MRYGDEQKGIPFCEYNDTKANIEALTGVSEGCIAYATDTDELGTYDGADWNWGSGGGVTDHGELDGLADDDHTQYVLRQPTANTVINESGGDFDFRIEGDTDENLFFVDAGNDRVGIGTPSPSDTFYILTGSASKGITISNVSTDDTIKYALIKGEPYHNADGAYVAFMGFSYSGNNTVRFGGGTAVAKAATNVIVFTAADTITSKGTERLYINGSGQIGINNTSPIISDGIGIHITGKILRLDTSKTPASAGATGNAGEICWDSDYIYVCVATNTWKRVAISTW